MSVIQYKIFREELDDDGKVHYYSFVVTNPFFRVEYFPGKWISKKKDVPYGLLTYNKYDFLIEPNIYGAIIEKYQWSVWRVECKNEMDTKIHRIVPVILMEIPSITSEVKIIMTDFIKMKGIPYAFDIYENYIWPNGTRMFKQIKMLEKIEWSDNK